MPWRVRNDHPDCGGFAVVKVDDANEIAPGGCHESEDEAQAHMAAMNMTEESDEGQNSKKSRMSKRFRALPLREPVARVDRENRIVYGVSLAQSVEALGHDILLDETSIGQIVALGNAKRSGVKSRFTHPGLSSDGLGKFLGRIRDLRSENGKAIGDLHLSDLAFKSPDGNLGDYVLDAADEDPEAFGFSIVFDGHGVWKLDDGSEMPLGNDGRPENALNDKPIVRIEELAACDLVDEPAANRDGMFSKHLWATNKLGEEVFGELDYYVQQYGFTPDKVFEVALKYAHARGVDLKEFTVSKETEVVKVEKEKAPEPTPTVDPKAFAQMQEEFQALKTELAAKEEAASEAEDRAKKLEAALDASNERIARMERDARRGRFRAMAAGWVGETKKHVDLLEQLADLSGEDGEAFQFYVQQQNTVTEQMGQSKLLEDIGVDTGDGGQELNAWEKIGVEAEKLMAIDAKLTRQQAITKVIESNRKLAEEYERERKGR